MACIRSSVLNMNFPGALAACKISETIFDKTDSLVLPSGEYSWWARTSKEDVSHLSGFISYKYNDKGKIDIKSTLFEISDEIHNTKTDDKFKKIINAFCALASDENFKHVVNERNSNRLNQYFEKMLSDDINSIKNHIQILTKNLEQERDMGRNIELYPQQNIVSRNNSISR